jgi:outer membrane cobalamin receptor
MKSKLNFLHFFFILAGFIPIAVNAQSTLSIQLLHAKDLRPVRGFIGIDKQIGYNTNDSGMVRIAIAPGMHEFHCQAIGFRDTIFTSVCTQQESWTILLQPEGNLEMLVIGGNRVSKPIEKLTVSMDVISSADITRKLTPNLSDAMERLSGVNIIDGQASIRGGSGYAYGAGSRVLLVVDNVPMMSADRNDIKWNFVPMELVKQIEVTKGAASVSYGASALNGIIHVRTAYAEGRPWTKFSTFHVIYPDTAGSALKWWGHRVPYQSSVSFAHAETTKGGLDWVLGANALSAQGWLQGDSEKRARITFKTRKYFKNQKGSWGLDGNFMFKKQGNFLIWSNDSTGAYLPISTTTNTFTDDLWMSLDPWVKWTANNGDQHQYRIRLFSTVQPYDVHLQPQSHNLIQDYQYKHTLPTTIRPWHERLGITSTSGTLSAGINASHQIYIDDAIGGAHNGNTAGAFIQFQRSWNDLEFLAGARIEMMRIDSIIQKGMPVQSYGINYPISQRTFLRASYGEGYRFPSPIERFVRYNIDVINIYPNPDLLPERGWNYEVGIKHIRKSDYATNTYDLAIFYTRYQNMTEFYFDKWGQNTDSFFGLGFKSVNITSARILGMELSTDLNGQIGRTSYYINGGYTYICPVDVETHPELKPIGNHLQYATQNFNDLQTGDASPILKYRYRHLAKLNADFVLQEHISLGAGARLYGFMERIDSVFTLFIPGIQSYRTNYTAPTIILDFRVGYQWRTNHKITYYCNNLLNRFAVLRPAKPEAPRSFGLQYSLEF